MFAQVRFLINIFSLFYWMFHMQFNNSKLMFGLYFWLRISFYILLSNSYSIFTRRYLLSFLQQLILFFKQCLHRFYFFKKYFQHVLVDALLVLLQRQVHVQLAYQDIIQFQLIVVQRLLRFCKVQHVRFLVIFNISLQAMFALVKLFKLIFLACFTGCSSCSSTTASSCSACISGYVLASNYCCPTATQYLQGTTCQASCNI